MDSYELSVRDITGSTEQPMKLKLSLSETVAQFRSHIAERLNLKPDEVFLVADATMSQELLQFSHEPDEANNYPVARLVKAGATVNFQIGRRTGVGPFISGTPAASESAKVKTDTDAYILSRLTATHGAHMSNEAEVVRTDRAIHAEISDTFANGEGTIMSNIIATSQHLIKKIIVEQRGKDLSNEQVLDLLTGK